MKRATEMDERTTVAESWERQTGETAKAYAAFSVYRDMGVHRSLRRVAQESSKDPAQIFRWNKRHGWQQRIAAYDAEIDRQWRSRLEDERLGAARRHADLLAGQLKLARPRTFTLSS